MRLVFAWALAGFGCALIQPARADILTCGNVLIREGDSADYALEKCGEPASRTPINEPIWARDANGNIYQAGSMQGELWRYKLGEGKFPALLRIANGVVESIKFEKTWG